MTTPISSRHRESSFLSVAHIWAEALRQWPKPIFVNPEPLTIESMVKKLREARTSKELYGWKHESISEVAWREFADMMTLHIEQGRIAIRNPNCKPEKITKVGSVEDPSVFKVERWDDPYLHAICLVLSNHWIEPQPRFLFKGLTKALVSELEIRYDVGFTETENENEWMTI